MLKSIMTNMIPVSKDWRKVHCFPFPRLGTAAIAAMLLLIFWRSVATEYVLPTTEQYSIQLPFDSFEIYSRF